MAEAIIQVIWLQDGQYHVILIQLGEIDRVNHKINYIELENTGMSRRDRFNYKGEMTAVMAEAGYVVSMAKKTEDTA